MTQWTKWRIGQPANARRLPRPPGLPTALNCRSEPVQELFRPPVNYLARKRTLGMSASRALFARHSLELFAHKEQPLPDVTLVKDDRACLSDCSDARTPFQRSGRYCCSVAHHEIPSKCDFRNLMRRSARARSLSAKYAFIRVLEEIAPRICPASACRAI